MGIWKIYGPQLIEERRKGKTLEQLGAEFGGVSRERVRRVLQKYHGTTEVLLPTEKDAAWIIGISHTHLRHLRKEGIVEPQQYGVRRWYSRQDVRRVKEYLQEHCICPICGGFKKRSSRACQFCWLRRRGEIEGE